MDIDLLEIIVTSKPRSLTVTSYAIYDLIFTHSDRRWEKGEPDDIQIYFEEPQMIDNPLPDQVMAEKRPVTSTKKL